MLNISYRLVLSLPIRLDKSSHTIFEKKLKRKNYYD